jgi:hypothetical protein
MSAFLKDRRLFENESYFLTEQRTTDLSANVLFQLSFSLPLAVAFLLYYNGTDD